MTETNEYVARLGHVAPVEGGAAGGFCCVARGTVVVVPVVWLLSPEFEVSAGVVALATEVEVAA